MPEIPSFDRMTLKEIIDSGAEDSKIEQTYWNTHMVKIRNGETSQDISLQNVFNRIIELLRTEKDKSLQDEGLALLSSLQSKVDPSKQLKTGFISFFTNLSQERMKERIKSMASLLIYRNNLTNPTTILKNTLIKKLKNFHDTEPIVSTLFREKTTTNTNLLDTFLKNNKEDFSNIATTLEQFIHDNLPKRSEQLPENKPPVASNEIAEPQSESSTPHPLRPKMTGMFVIPQPSSQSSLSLPLAARPAINPLFSPLPPPSSPQSEEDVFNLLNEMKSNFPITQIASRANEIVKNATKESQTQEQYSAHSTTIDQQIKLLEKCKKNYPEQEQFLNEQIEKLKSAKDSVKELKKTLSKKKNQWKTVVNDFEEKFKPFTKGNRLALKEFVGCLNTLKAGFDLKDNLIDQLDNFFKSFIDSRLTDKAKLKKDLIAFTTKLAEQDLLQNDTTKLTTELENQIAQCNTSSTPPPF